MDYLDRPKIITRVFIRGTQEEPKLEEKIEAEIGVMCFEAGGRGHKTRNAGGH